MKIRTLMMAIAMISVLILAACAGGVKDKEITVENVVVSGDAKDMVKVVDGVYTLKNARDMLTLSVEFELLEQEEMEEEEEEEVEEVEAQEIEMLGPWTLTLLDASGAAIPNCEGLSLASNDEVKILELLNDGEAGDKVMVTFEKAIPNKDDIQDIVDETGTFEIMTALTYGEIEEMVTTTETTTPQPPAEPQPDPTPSTDWDKELDRYESLVNRMIVLHRKVTQGDPTAMADYLKIKEQAEALDKKLDDAKDMNDAQMARFINLQKKMLNALAS